MTDAVAWVSLVVSVVVAAYTGVLQLLAYRRAHIPRLTVFARAVTLLEKREEEGGISMERGLEISVVNTGSRLVEIAEMHTQDDFQGSYWLEDAQGRVSVRLAPGESQQWTENLEVRFRKLAMRNPERPQALRLRVVATTADGRKFHSADVEVGTPC
jgi:hypothetical protein